MRLSAEQFAELAATFSGYSPKTEQHERRRAARIDLRAQVTIRMLREHALSAPQSVTVVSFSSRGLAMLYHEPLEEGTQFVTELPRKNGGSVSLLCTVMHGHLIVGDLYQLGVEFTCVLRNAVSQADPNHILDELRRIRASVLE